MGRYLKTQDKLKIWDVPSSIVIEDLRCPLCLCVQDSHAHLFFSCTYSSQVWDHIRMFAGMDDVAANWPDIVGWLLPISNQNVCRSVIGRLILGASA